MSNKPFRTEFRYNKKRKHYSYVYGAKGDYRRNLLLSTKPTRKVKKGKRIKIIDNVVLYKHPNPDDETVVYLIKQRYIDNEKVFNKPLKDWKFHVYDKRKVKRIKKNKWK